MMTQIRPIIVYALLVMMVSCHRDTRPVGDTSRNALDWQGRYHGILPCADCPGILTVIQLNEDNTFTMSSFYLGKGDTQIVRNGSFSWDDAEREITLKGLSGSADPVYKVGEDRLIPVAEATADDRYTLTKNHNDITNIYWRLVRVNDTQVGQHRKEPHLVLLSKDSTAFGNGSCNNFRGAYKITGDIGISFSPMAATKMACMEDMNVENQFLQALMEVSRYEVSEDSLFLMNDQSVRTARFTLSYH